MADLSIEHGVEFAQVYRTGPGANGGGGTYWLYSGVANRVTVPLGADVMFISHTHPGGTRYASEPDLNVLAYLQGLGSPQQSSLVVLPDGEVIRYGGKWMRNGTLKW
jgi:hypothetical protein